MVAAGGIHAGQAFVELFVDDSRLIRGLRAAQKRLAAFGQSIRDLGLRFAALGSALLAQLALATRSFVETGSALVDRAVRTKASVEALSALGFAADKTGASIEAVEADMRVMQKTILAAGAGPRIRLSRISGCPWRRHGGSGVRDRNLTDIVRLVKWID